MVDILSISEKETIQKYRENCYYPVKLEKSRVAIIKSISLEEKGKIKKETLETFATHNLLMKF